jgi:diguanylate cyclase (GGDEF)-like protein
LGLVSSFGRRGVLPIGVAAVAAVGALDFATGVEARIFPLYFLPVSFVSWRLGRGAGVAIAVLSAFTWQASNFLAGMDRAGWLVLAWNTAVQLLAFLVVALLIAELKGKLENELALSRTDSLTGIANGLAFRERAILEVERSRRWGRPLTLAFVDLDDFKAVNDTRGHGEGDEVLRVAAASLGSALRSTDLLARIGGDEFVILLPETDETGARVVLDAARSRLRQEMQRGGWPVTASIGWVTAVEPVDADSLIRQADAAMYEVKRSGKAARALPGAPPPS